MRSATTTGGVPRDPERRIGARAVVALAIVAGLALAMPDPARAGVYRAALCDPGLVAFHADASFERSSRHYLAGTSCKVGGEGLVARSDSGPTRVGAWGAWVIRAPKGASISALSVKAAGRSRGGHLPELLTGSARPRPFATPTGGLRRFRWSGRAARTFVARLRCRRAPRCRRGRGSRVRVKRVAMVLHDRLNPSLRPDGSLFAPGSRRGTRAVVPAATDLGGGVRRFLVQVNGVPVTAHTVGCRLARRIAIRLRPCPVRARTRFGAATASPPFRQGPNLVRVCAADYAVTTAANRACAKRRVRVDTLCPVSQVGGARSLRAWLVRRGAGATVGGRLLDARARGVSGARICVATRVRMRGVSERVALVALTGAGGRFRARVPSGPSREVRIAYWPSATAALERYLRLEVPVRPRLRLRPRHPIENGDRVHFEVRLPGPSAARRRVRIQARAGRRWLDVRSGRTGARGIYRARYRFHATSHRRRYRFRAVVPKQRGYPYEAGKSKAQRVTVLG